MIILGCEAPLARSPVPRLREDKEIISSRTDRAIDGGCVPLICDYPDGAHAVLERHVCIDTTASGGNVQLLSEIYAKDELGSQNPLDPGEARPPVS